MSSVRELHAKAMALSDKAETLLGSNADEARALLKEAYTIEAQAASLVEAKEENEPTRSVLYTSAASLAMQARDFKFAQRLVALGLSGYPQPREEEGLKELFEQITMESHLDLKGVILEKNDLQFSIFGDFIGAGFAPLNMFRDRIDGLGSLLKRTYERLSGADYCGKKPSGHFGLFQPVISVPRVSSFAVTVRLARPQREQIPLIEQVTAADVIDEVMTCVEYINLGEEDKLGQRIPNEGYYRNFVSLVKNVAPDGDKVKLVGLTTNKKRIQFVKTRKKVSKLPVPKPVQEIELIKTPYEGMGQLDYVSGRDDLIGLVVGNETIHVSMRVGLEDFVKLNYGRMVHVIGERDRNGVVQPDDIIPVEE